MPILPALVPLFETLNPQPTTVGAVAVPTTDQTPDVVDLQAARQDFEDWLYRDFASLQRDVEPLSDERRVDIPVEGGAIGVTVYGHGDDTLRPGHLHLHGGGFWLGSAALDAGFCRMLAREADCVVVAADYRLAPEHPWPVPPDDCWAAMRWVSDNASTIGVDRALLSVGGSSAGACLAAGVALRARDEGLGLRLQVLDIPVTDLTTTAPKVMDDGLVVDGGKSDYSAKYVSPQNARAASPLHAPDLTGVAPALVVVAEYDQLEPDGLRYAERLKQSDVPVRLHRLPGQFHGSSRLAALVPDEAKEFDDFIISGLRQHRTSDGACSSV